MVTICALAARLPPRAIRHSPMANKTGVKRGISLGKVIETWISKGYSSKATARELGCYDSNIRRRLRRAAANGDKRIDPKRLARPNQISALAEDVLKAQVELGYRAERKERKGDWRKATYIPGLQSVILLGVFGDPHIDNPGFDMEQFEEEVSRRDPDNGIYTCCVGDFFDNWPRVMGHLYKQSGDPAPAWTLFEHWMTNWPFLFSVSGNHDEFNDSTVGFLDVFMRERGMILRRSGGRFILDMGGNPVSVSMRHIWRGNSMYSEAHALKRAATFGHTDDDLIIGGHIHQGELRTNIRPHDGRVQRLVQVSSFKKLDDYANDRGFMSPETPPVVWCVIDGREPLDSHTRVQSFYDFSSALAVKKNQESRNG